MGDTLKEGLLLKEEAQEAKWKKRWVVLRVGKDTAAMYYYKVTDYINQNVPLSSFKVQSCSLYEYLAKPFSFELVLPPVINPGSGIVNPANHFRFQATTAEEQQNWMNILRPHTTPIEEMQLFRSSPSSDTSSAVISVSEVSGSLENMALPRKKIRDFGDDEIALTELFPDVQVEIILDALDFCDGNRNAAIQLLAKQNRLSTPTEGLSAADDLEEGEVDDSWSDDSYYSDKADVFSEDSVRQEAGQRGSSSWQICHKKDPIQPLIQRSASWHRVESSIPKNSSDFGSGPSVRKHPDDNSCQFNSVGDESATGGVIQKLLIDLRIVGAVRNGSYMEYILEVVVPDMRWLVYRRYSNFYALHEQLKKIGVANPAKHILPPKGIKGDKSDALVKKRVTALGKYLDALVETNSSLFLTNYVGKTFLDPKIPSVFYNKHAKCS